MTISLGVSSAPAHGWHPSALVEAADQSMNAAKHAGRNLVARFEPAAVEQCSEEHAGAPR